MRRTLRIAPLMGLLSAVLLLPGCSSGGGEGPRTVGTSFAPGQVAAGLYVMQWSQILWGLQASQTGGQTPEFGEPIMNDDGTFSQTYTGPDGTFAVITALLDGTLRLEITYPDGSTQTVLQGVPQFDGWSKTSIDWEVTSADGTVVRYTTVVDDQGTIFDGSDDTAEMFGAAEQPGELTQQFEVATAGGRSRLASRQSDGSVFTLDVPLVPDYGTPDFTRPTEGTYELDGLVIAFTLSATAAAPSRWARMSFSGPGGLTGESALAADFGGSGRVLQDGQLVALPEWRADGDAQINWVSAQSSQTAPAGAVLDYIAHRWQTLAALLAPAPG